jgi:hypothetical protein
MNKALAIKHLFPTAVPGRDFLVKDDGDGQYIAEWNLQENIPTEAELQSAWEAYRPPEPPKSKVELLQETVDQLVVDNLMRGL